MTAALLSAIAGTVASLLFSYIPGLSTWYAALTETVKKLIMLVVLVVVAAAIFGMNCAGLFKAYIPTVSCDQAGVEQFIVILAAAAVANQTAYKLSPTTSKVSEAKSAVK